MLNNETSKNITLKVVMDQLGLTMTKAYPIITIMENIKVPYVCIIKDLVVFLDELPNASITMDVMVV